MLVHCSTDGIMLVSVGALHKITFILGKVHKIGINSILFGSSMHEIVGRLGFAPNSIGTCNVSLTPYSCM